MATPKKKAAPKTKPGKEKKAAPKADTAAASPKAPAKKNKRKFDPDHWAKMAKEPNARTVMCNTPDTFPLMDLAKSADQGLKRLRNGLLTRYNAEEVLPLMEKFNKSLVNLESVIAEIAQVTGMDFYKKPRSIAQLEEQAKPKKAA